MACAARLRRRRHRHGRRHQSTESKGQHPRKRTGDLRLRAFEDGVTIDKHADRHGKWWIRPHRTRFRAYGHRRLRTINERSATRAEILADLQTIEDALPAGRPKPRWRKGSDAIGLGISLFKIRPASPPCSTHGRAGELSSSRTPAKTILLKDRAGVDIADRRSTSSRQYPPHAICEVRLRQGFRLRPASDDRRKPVHLRSRFMDAVKDDNRLASRRQGPASDDRLSSTTSWHPWPRLRPCSSTLSSRRT